MKIAIVASHSAARRLLQVEGEIDLATGPTLQRHVDEALADGATDILIDMSGVSFMDSSGVRVLLSCRESLPAKGRLALIGPSLAVRRLLEVTGLDTAIEVFDSLQDAARG